MFLYVRYISSTFVLEWCYCCSVIIPWREWLTVCGRTEPLSCNTIITFSFITGPSAASVSHRSSKLVPGPTSITRVLPMVPSVVSTWLVVVCTGIACWLLFRRLEIKRDIRTFKLSLAGRAMMRRTIPTTVTSNEFCISICIKQWKPLPTVKEETNLNYVHFEGNTLNYI